MVSYKKKFYTGSRIIREDTVKSYKPHKMNDASTTPDPSDTSAASDGSRSDSSVSYLFNNKMNQSNQMMGNSMMNQMPQMNQFNPMGNQFNPMMNQMPQMNQFDPMMNQMAQMNQFDPMMNSMNPMMMGNNNNNPMNYDALSIQTMAPVNRQHNGSINGINNLALLNNNNNNNNMNNANYTEMSDIHVAARPYRGMNHAGINHAGMNYDDIPTPTPESMPPMPPVGPTDPVVAPSLNNLAKL